MAGRLSFAWCTSWSLGLPSLDDPRLNTRKELRGRLVSWLCNVKRDRNIFWVTEPPGTPNDLTAAKTFAVICTEIRRLGVYYDFTATNVVSGLAGQLAARHPPYRSLLAKQFIDIPTLRKQSVRSQLKKLIFEPWRALQTSHPHYVTTPPVIILDWCDDHLHSSIRELFELISEYSLPNHCSLLWVFVGCPGPGVRPAKQNRSLLPAPCENIQLSINDNEVPEDTELILRHSFHRFRQEHKEMFDEDEVWPSREQISELVKIISGVLEFVDVVLRFINSEENGPKAQLDAFLAYMANSPSPSDLTRYRTLDHFYIHALSNIPSDVLPDAIDILQCLYYVYPTIYLNPRHLAYLLGLQQGVFSRAFTHLQWATVLTTQLPQLLGRCDLDLLFRNFVRDSSRSRDTFPIWSALPVVRAFLRVLSHSHSFLHMLKEMKWTPSEPLEYISEVSFLVTSALGKMWRIPIDTQPLLKETTLYDNFGSFDFRCLVSVGHKIPPLIFAKFLQWLHTASFMLRNSTYY